MSFRVTRRLAPADAVTLANAAIGVGAMLAALVADPSVVARLLLLAAVADGLDGIVARSVGGSTVGPTLDAMADVVSFGAAPAAFVLAVAAEGWGPLREEPTLLAVAAAVAIAYVLASILRSALYTVHFPEASRRPGVQNTLAASILAAGYLAGVTEPAIVLGATAVFAALMLAPIPYPKLAARDALAMGVVQTGAIAVPMAIERILPRTLLVAALLYMLLAPWFYWDEQ